jgi:transposase
MPYSEDLRLRVLGAIDAGMSKMTAHKTFRVSRSTIDDWLKLRQHTGSVKANTSYRRGKAPTIHDLPAFAEFVRRHSGCTLKQLAQAWEQETGVKLSLMPFSHALRRIGAQGKGWTRKKRVGATVNATRKSDKPFSRS